MESAEILTLRAMAWQRARGELMAMLATYPPASGSLGGGGPEQEARERDDMATRVRAFIAALDDRLSSGA